MKRKHYTPCRNKRTPATPQTPPPLSQLFIPSNLCEGDDGEDSQLPATPPTPTNTPSQNPFDPLPTSDVLFLTAKTATIEAKVDHLTRTLAAVIYFIEQEFPDESDHFFSEFDVDA